jgi:hypothetical protein
MLTREKVDESRAEEASAGGAPPHRPFWPVALLLFGLVVAILGGALLLDRQFRTPLTIEPVPTSATAGRPTAVPTSAPGAASTVVPTPTTANAPALQATPAAVSTSTVAPAVPLATAAPSPTSATSSRVLTPMSTASARVTLEQLPPLHREIAEAYLRYWDVLTQAHFDVDASRLGEVLAGVELERTENDIRRLRAEGRASRLEVELHFRILQATPNDAVVADQYVNRSVYVDAVTKQEIPTKEPPSVTKIDVQMRKLDGVWKVVDVARHY